MKTRNTVQNYDGLSEQEMRYFVPAIYAEQPHEDRSDKYAFFPTGRSILPPLAEVGLVPVMAMQQKSLRPGQQGFGKHLVELCPRSELGYRRDGGATRIIIVNSHNASCSYVIMAGRIRFICENGVISGDIDSTLRIPHKGNVVENVVAASIKVTLLAGKLAEELESWKHIMLSQAEKLIFARYAIAERFDQVVDADPQPAAVTLYRPEDAIRPQRQQDYGDSLYKTYQVVEERLTKGGYNGIVGTSRDDHGNRQRRRARALGSIDGKVSFEQRLHLLAREMAAQKG